MIHQNKISTQATFGAGCFWGVESAFMSVNGVNSTEVGYMGGNTLSPSYKDVCTGITGHAEVVHINFNPAKVSYVQLLDIFWLCHDPTQYNRQGADIGSQYRSVIFYYSTTQKHEAQTSLSLHRKNVNKPIATKIDISRDFWRAEEAHQKYFHKKGITPPCHF